MKVDESLKKILDFLEPSSGILEEIAALRLLIKDTDSNLIAFALYRGVANREMALQALKDRLTLPVAEFTLSSHQKNPIKFLHELPFQERGCLFFFGLEDALPEAAGYLNLQREAFAEVPHAVVFWVTEYGLREIANHAPDFWAWRSGVFDFRSSTAAPLDIIEDLTSFPSGLHGQHDLERRLNLYQELFKEYSGREDADERFLSSLNIKQSIAYLFMMRFSDAEAQAREGLDRVRTLGTKTLEVVPLLIISMVASISDRLEEAEALAKEALTISESSGLSLGNSEIFAIFTILGDIALKRNHLDLAKSYFLKAQETNERLGDERNTAYIYEKFGRVAEERGEDEAAAQWYQQALEIRERLGLLRENAFLYLRLGRIAKDRGQIEAAEQWYRKALDTAEHVGLERETAVALNKLGGIAQERGHLDVAQDWHKKALEIYERLGLDKDTADEYYALGNIYKENNKLEAAEQAFGKALEIHERLGLHYFQVLTLLSMGVVEAERNRSDQAILYMGKAWTISFENRLERGLSTAEQVLSIFLKGIGETNFIAAWRQHFPDQEPPLEAIRQAAAKLEETEE